MVRCVSMMFFGLVICVFSEHWPSNKWSESQRSQLFWVNLVFGGCSPTVFACSVIPLVSTSLVKEQIVALSKHLHLVELMIDNCLVSGGSLARLVCNSAVAFEATDQHDRLPEEATYIA